MFLCGACICGIYVVHLCVLYVVHCVCPICVCVLYVMCIWCVFISWCVCACVSSQTGGFGAGVCRGDQWVATATSKGLYRQNKVI